MSYVEGTGDVESRMSCSGDDNQEIDMSEVEKYRLERENAQWPDEIETPHNVPARERFQKYRGLKSFRYIFGIISYSHSILILEHHTGTRRRISR